MVEIVDEQSAEAWLKTQPHQVRVWMSARAALRALPAVAHEDNDALFYRLALVSFRANLTSGAAGTCPAPEVSGLADAARSAASAAAFSAFSASSAADSAFSAAFSAYSNDTQLVDTRDWQPLWPDQSIEALQPLFQAWEDFKARVAGDPDWDFWVEWYEGCLHGRPMDWDLIFQIAATLTKEDWETPASAATAIRAVRAKWEVEQAGYQEKLILDPDTLLFSAQPMATSNEERLALLLSRVEDAMDDVITLGGGNGLTQTRVEFLILSRLVRKYATDPERVALDLSEIGRSLRGQIDIGEYPDDPPMKILQGTLAAGVSEICDMDPEVASSVERQFGGTPREPTKEDVLLLTEAMQISAAMMDEATAQTTQEDAAELLEGRIIDAAEPDASDVVVDALRLRQSVLRRQISRLGQQHAEMYEGGPLAKHYETDMHKTARVVVTYGGLSGFFAAVIGILARLAGFY